jgi:hypothetical protein
MPSWLRELPLLQCERRERVAPALKDGLCTVHPHLRTAVWRTTDSARTRRTRASSARGDYAKGKKQYLVIGDSVSLLYFGPPANAALTNSSRQHQPRPTMHAPIHQLRPHRKRAAMHHRVQLGTGPDRWDVISYNFGMWNDGAAGCNLTDEGQQRALRRQATRRTHAPPSMHPCSARSRTSPITDVLMQTRAGRALSQTQATWCGYGVTHFSP